MEDKPSLEELAHYGVPGMRWGVKKARTGDLVKPIARLDRVANGTASLHSKAVVLASSTPYHLIKSGGLKKEAARQSRSLKAHSERLATGHATARDLIVAYGTSNLISVARTLKKDKPAKK
jgi:hypothetical protein